MDPRGDHGHEQRERGFAPQQHSHACRRRNDDDDDDDDDDPDMRDRTAPATSGGSSTFGDDTTTTTTTGDGPLTVSTRTAALSSSSPPPPPPPPTTTTAASSRPPPLLQTATGRTPASAPPASRGEAAFGAPRQAAVVADSSNNSSSSSPAVAVGYLVRLFKVLFLELLPSVLVGLLAMLFAPHYLADNNMNAPLPGNNAELGHDGAHLGAASPAPDGNNGAARRLTLPRGSSFRGAFGSFLGRSGRLLAGARIPGSKGTTTAAAAVGGAAHGGGGSNNNYSNSSRVIHAHRDAAAAKVGHSEVRDDNVDMKTAPGLSHSSSSSSSSSSASPPNLAATADMGNANINEPIPFASNRNAMPDPDDENDIDNIQVDMQVMDDDSDASDRKSVGYGVGGDGNRRRKQDEQDDEEDDDDEEEEHYVHVGGDGLSATHLPSQKRRSIYAARPISADRWASRPRAASHSADIDEVEDDLLDSDQGRISQTFVQTSLRARARHRAPQSAVSASMGLSSTRRPGRSASPVATVGPNVSVVAAVASSRALLLLPRPQAAPAALSSTTAAAQVSSHVPTDATLVMGTGPDLSLESDQASQSKNISHALVSDSKVPQTIRAQQQIDRIPTITTAVSVAGTDLAIVAQLSDPAAPPPSPDPAALSPVVVPSSEALRPIEPSGEKSFQEGSVSHFHRADHLLELQPVADHRPPFCCSLDGGEMQTNGIDIQNGDSLASRDAFKSRQIGAQLEPRLLEDGKPCIMRVPSVHVTATPSAPSPLSLSHSGIAPAKAVIGSVASTDTRDNIDEPSSLRESTERSSVDKNPKSESKLYQTPVASGFFNEVPSESAIMLARSAKSGLSDDGQTTSEKLGDDPMTTRTGATVVGAALGLASMATIAHPGLVVEISETTSSTPQGTGIAGKTLSRIHSAQVVPPIPVPLAVAEVRSMRHLTNVAKSEHRVDHFLKDSVQHDVRLESASGGPTSSAYTMAKGAVPANITSDMQNDAVELETTSILDMQGSPIVASNAYCASSVDGLDIAKLELSKAPLVVLSNQPAMAVSDKVPMSQTTRVVAIDRSSGSEHKVFDAGSRLKMSSATTSDSYKRGFTDVLHVCTVQQPELKEVDCLRDHGSVTSPTPSKCTSYASSSISSNALHGSITGISEVFDSTADSAQSAAMITIAESSPARRQDFSRSDLISSPGRIAGSTAGQPTVEERLDMDRMNTGTEQLALGGLVMSKGIERKRSGDSLNLNRSEGVDQETTSDVDKLRRLNTAILMRVDNCASEPRSQVPVPPSAQASKCAAKESPNDNKTSAAPLGDDPYLVPDGSPKASGASSRSFGLTTSNSDQFLPADSMKATAEEMHGINQPRKVSNFVSEPPSDVSPLIGPNVESMPKVALDPRGSILESVDKTVHSHKGIADDASIFSQVTLPRLVFKSQADDGLPSGRSLHSDVGSMTLTRDSNSMGNALELHRSESCHSHDDASHIQVDDEDAEGDSEQESEVPMNDTDNTMDDEPAERLPDRLQGEAEVDASIVDDNISTDIHKFDLSKAGTASLPDAVLSSAAVKSRAVQVPAVIPPAAVKSRAVQVPAVVLPSIALHRRHVDYNDDDDDDSEARENDTIGRLVPQPINVLPAARLFDPSPSASHFFTEDPSKPPHQSDSACPVATSMVSLPLDENRDTLKRLDAVPLGRLAFTGSSDQNVSSQKECVENTIEPAQGALPLAMSGRPYRDPDVLSSNLVALDENSASSSVMARVAAAERAVRESEDVQRNVHAPSAIELALAAIRRHSEERSIPGVDNRSSTTDSEAPGLGSGEMEHLAGIADERSASADEQSALRIEPGDKVARNAFPIPAESEAVIDPLERGSKTARRASSSESSCRSSSPSKVRSSAPKGESSRFRRPTDLLVSSSPTAMKDVELEVEHIDRKPTNFPCQNLPLRLQSNVVDASDDARRAISEKQKVSRIARRIDSDGNFIKAREADDGTMSERKPSSTIQDETLLAGGASEADDRSAIQGSHASPKDSALVHRIRAESNDQALVMEKKSIVLELASDEGKELSSVADGTELDDLADDEVDDEEGGSQGSVDDGSDHASMFTDGRKMSDNREKISTSSSSIPESNQYTPSVQRQLSGELKTRRRVSAVPKSFNTDDIDDDDEKGTNPVRDMNSRGLGSPSVVTHPPSIQSDTGNTIELHPPFQVSSGRSPNAGAYRNYHTDGEASEVVGRLANLPANQRSQAPENGAVGRVSPAMVQRQLSLHSEDSSRPRDNFLSSPSVGTVHPDRQASGISSQRSPPSMPHPYPSHRTPPQNSPERGRRLVFSRQAPSKEVADVKESIKKILKRNRIPSPQHQIMTSAPSWKLASKRSPQRSDSHHTESGSPQVRGSPGSQSRSSPISSALREANLRLVPTSESESHNRVGTEFLERPAPGPGRKGLRAVQDGMEGNSPSHVGSTALLQENRYQGVGPSETTLKTRPSAVPLAPHSQSLSVPSPPSQSQTTPRSTGSSGSMPPPPPPPPPPSLLFRPIASSSTSPPVPLPPPAKTQAVLNVPRPVPPTQLGSTVPIATPNPPLDSPPPEPHVDPPPPVPRTLPEQRVEKPSNDGTGDTELLPPNWARAESPNSNMESSILSDSGNTSSVDAEVGVIQPVARTMAPAVTQFVSGRPVAETVSMIGEILMESGCTVSVKRNNQKMKVEAPYGSPQKMLYASISMEPIMFSGEDGVQQRTMVTVMRAKDDKGRTPVNEFVNFFHLLRTEFAEFAAE